MLQRTISITTAESLRALNSQPDDSIEAEESEASTLGAEEQDTPSAEQEAESAVELDQSEPEKDYTTFKG